MLERHRLFISYRHSKEDLYYKLQLDRLFADKYINKSVVSGEYDPDNSDEYIKRLIREDKISSSSVIIVLCGPDTWGRKHIDWEISAGLNKKVNGLSGLICVWLPNHPDYGLDKYKPALIPPRLAANMKSGYAKGYDWDYFVNNYRSIIEEAFDNRVKLADLADNSLPQMERNRN